MSFVIEAALHLRTQLNKLVGENLHFTLKVGDVALVLLNVTNEKKKAAKQLNQLLQHGGWCEGFPDFGVSLL